MRNLFPIAFLGFFLAGCYESHGLSPVIPMGDAGPGPVSDSGWVMPEPDSGPTEPDSGPVVLADAGSDAFVPMADAGSDAGPHVCMGGPNYVLNLASSPLSSTVTAGETGVPSVGITLTTPVDSGLTYTMFRILGRGDTDGTFRTEHFRDVVTSCTLFEEDVPLGAGAPDERGLIVIGGFSHHLDVGRSANIRIECDTDTDVAQPSGDRYVVALNGLIRDAEPVTATDDFGCERQEVWGRNLLDQLESDDPRVVITVTAPPICEAVDVPADGSGRVIVRVEGGGDMTVPPDTDFVAFSVTIENHTPGSVSAGTIERNWTLSSDCTVPGPGVHLDNECDPANGFRIAMCGGGTCGTSCAVQDAVFASGTSTRFTLYAHSRAAGTFGLELTSFVGSPTWISFRDASGSLMSTDVVDGDESSLRPTAIITVP